MFSQILFAIFLLIPQLSLGSVDPRELSNFGPVGRLERTDRCTVTLISNSCVLTAGHCLFYDEYIDLDPPDYVEFNVPRTKNFVVQSTTPENKYKIDYNYYMANTSSLYSEYGVLKLKPNSITHKQAGEVQGYYQISDEKAVPGTIIRITGFGISQDPSKHQSQKTITGILTSSKSLSYLKYSKVFSTSGDSGSAIIINSTNKIIGIHTTSDTQPGAGFGTSITDTPEFVDAINRCLELENN